MNVGSQAMSTFVSGRKSLTGICSLPAFKLVRAGSWELITDAKCSPTPAPLPNFVGRFAEMRQRSASEGRRERDVGCVEPGGNQYGRFWAR
jgi:hypothetical protein